MTFLQHLLQKLVSYAGMSVTRGTKSCAASRANTSAALHLDMLPAARAASSAVVHGGKVRSRAQQLRQLGDVGGDAPRLVAGEEVCRRTPPRLLLRNRRRRTKKTRVPKNPRRVLACCRRCFWGSPLACDPSQRKCAPATVDEILTRSDHTSKRRRGMGRPRRLGWCRVGVSTMTHGSAPCTGMVDEALKRPPAKLARTCRPGRRPPSRLLLEIDVGERLAVGVAGRRVGRNKAPRVCGNVLRRMTN
jgi:hypothetical protein